MQPLTYPEADRQIFQYVDAAGKEVYGDPIAIYERLQIILGGEARTLIKASRSKEPHEALPARDRLGGAVGLAFNLGPPLDPNTGQGYTLTTWRNALGRLLDFFEQRGGSTGPCPI